MARGTGLDSQLDRLLWSLDSSFSAALDRSEEEAADDLALSLRQGQTLLQHLSHIPVGVRDGDSMIPVVEVGRDFVRTAGGNLYPGRATMFRTLSTGTAPRSTDRYLGEVLRAAVRSGASVDLEGTGGQVAGLLVHCGPDHVCVRTRDGDVLIALEGIWTIKLSHED